MVIEWSEEDQVFVVSFPEWGKYAHTHGATYDEAVHQGQEVLELLIADTRKQGKPLPLPRKYRGMRQALERRHAHVAPGVKGRNQSCCR
jgi:antitoxin HicB